MTILSVAAKWLALAGLLGASLAHGQSNWLTLVGDPANPAVNTIDVDPRIAVLTERLRTMKLRVNRAAQRLSRDGLPYRSFEAEVLIDCVARVGHYNLATFYMEPLWKGLPHTTVVYPTDRPRTMEFRSVEPNPTERIIRAACQATGSSD